MTTYAVLKKMESEGMLKEAIKSGVVSVTLAGQKMIYEVYLNAYKENKLITNKRQAAVATSIKTNTSLRHVFRIIKDMES